jgi:hypothetical protein
MQDGDFLVVKDKTEEEKPLSDAERAVLEKQQAARKKCVSHALLLALFVLQLAVRPDFACFLRSLDCRASTTTTYTRPKEKGVRILTHQQREEAALKLKIAAGEGKAPASAAGAASTEVASSDSKPTEMSLDIAEDDMAAAAESVRDMGF